MSTLPTHLGFPACCPGLTIYCRVSVNCPNNKVETFSQFSSVGGICTNGPYWIFFCFSFDPLYLALFCLGPGFFPMLSPTPTPLLHPILFSALGIPILLLRHYSNITSSVRSSLMPIDSSSLLSLLSSM